MNLAFLITNWNASKQTISTIKMLLNLQVEYEFHIYINDNDSLIDDYDVLRVFCEPIAEVTLIRTNPHPGVTQSYNTLFNLQRDNFDISIRIDNDVTCTSEAINQIMNEFKINRRCGIVSPRLYVKDSHTLNNGVRKINEKTGFISNINSSKPNISEVFLGAFYGSRNDAFTGMEFYDADLVFFAEELEQALRLRSKKWLIIFLPTDDCYHDCGFSTGKMTRLAEYLNMRNHVMVLNKYYLSYKYVRNLRLLISALMRSIRMRTLSPILGYLSAIFNKSKSRNIEIFKKKMR